MHLDHALARASIRFAVLFVVLALSGCGGGPREEVASAPPSDDAITEAVQRLLAKDPFTPENRLEVSTSEGIVTVAGTVDRLLERDRAVGLPARVRGVRTVVDRIEVGHGDRGDAAIAEDVQEALSADPATAGSGIASRVEDGVVTLTGTVPSVPDKQLAVRLVRGVLGVRGVNDEIEVDFDTTRPDEEVAAEIRRRLLFDAWVDHGSILVNVENGIASLEGEVANLYEKTRAASDAFVAGVREVDDSALRVNGALRRPLERDKPVPMASMGDPEIRGAILDAFRLDPRMKDPAPEVVVEDGVVTLRGPVADVRAKQAAVGIAERTAGVVLVEDFLNVAPEETVDDEALERRVRAALGRDAYTAGEPIAVGVSDGEVTLYGEVERVETVRRAESVAAAVRGAMAVSNRLRLLADSRGAADEEIAENIRDQIRWSLLLDPEEIEVRVEDGVAILEGEVDTWHERAVAGENAFEGGALDVVNRIGVRRTAGEGIMP